MNLSIFGGVGRHVSPLLLDISWASFQRNSALTVPQHNTVIYSCRITNKNAFYLLVPFTKFMPADHIKTGTNLQSTSHFLIYSLLYDVLTLIILFITAAGRKLKTSVTISSCYSFPINQNSAAGLRKCH
jgi:hypothetical protein